MLVEQVGLKNFRNYSSLEMTFDGGVHLFSGCNAQGKTNLLEAIFLSAMGKSFRAGHDDELIGWESGEGNVEIRFSNRIASHEMNFKFMRGEGRENILNGRPVRKKELIGLMNAVLFSPEDLWLIKGSPAARRRFLDFELSQTDSLYYQDLMRYNRILVQRNQLLKKISDGSEKKAALDSWDEHLIVLATKIVGRRLERVERLSSQAGEIHGKITGGAEIFSARYLIYGEKSLSAGEYGDWYRETLEKARLRDIFRGNTDAGPHKDDIELTVNSHEAKLFASQGQQRTIVLALKMAEIEIMQQITGEFPVLLLDDVMSELDEHRKEKLIEAISGKIQTFVTGTEELECLRSVSHNCYYIRDGCVYRR